MQAPGMDALGKSGLWASGSQGSGPFRLCDHLYSPKQRTTEALQSTGNRRPLEVGQAWGRLWGLESWVWTWALKGLSCSVRTLECDQELCW